MIARLHEFALTYFSIICCSYLYYNIFDYLAKLLSKITNLIFIYIYIYNKKSKYLVLVFS